jgi:Protein of unknown function (DUF3141)
MMRQMHPNRLRFTMFSDKNPMMQPVKALAQSVREARKPVAPDNPLLSLEKVAATFITTWWEGYQQARDAMTEAMFLGVYGSPLLQAMVGLGTEHAPTERRSDRELVREADEAKMRVELERRFEVGGLPQAVLRALIYVRMPERSVDERGFAALQSIRAMQPVNDRMSMAELKACLKEQYLLVRLDEERAVRAIPRLLPDSEHARRAALDALLQVLGARGALPEEGLRRLGRIEALFGLEGEAPALRAANA